MKTRLLIIALLFICFKINAQTEKIEIDKNPICIDGEAKFRYISQGLTSVNWTYPEGTTIITSTADGIGYQIVTFNTPGEKKIVAKATISGVQRTDTLIVKVSELKDTYVDIKIDNQPTATYILNMSANINNQLSIPPHRYTWIVESDTSPQQSVSSYTYRCDKADEYHVKLNVSDAGGCAVSVDTTVSIDTLFKAPNVFTPNNDGINDTFIVKSTGNIPFSIEIYDRSGRLVYKPNLVVTQLVWDGRNSSGILVRPGVYFYVITPEDSSITPLKGFVHVFHDEK